ncbi:MAG TPA: hypothetical protein VJH24_06115 [Candidatus Bilamarchaeaceae archaeon]|nr:hypothetical protein [Candidatus Bilamarchaeaceae archaeon]
MAKKTKVIDKWKLKTWFPVLAPPLFEQQEIGEVAANEERHIVNRVLRVGLNELISSGSQNAFFTTLQFRVIGVEGGKGKTALIGHEVSPSYIRTFARRGKTLLHMNVDVQTKDEQELRIKVIAITAGRISETTIRNTRKVIIENVIEQARPLTYDELMQAILYGRFVSHLYNAAKKITAMRRVEIRKTEKKEVFT